METYLILDCTDPENYIKYNDNSIIINYMNWVIAQSMFFVIFRLMHGHYYYFGHAPSYEGAEKLIEWKQYLSETQLRNYYRFFPKDKTLKEQIEFCLKLRYPIDKIPTFLADYKWAEKLWEENKLPNHPCTRDFPERQNFSHIMN
mgnify:CR=1 FL=1